MLAEARAKRGGAAEVVARVVVELQAEQREAQVRGGERGVLAGGVVEARERLEDRRVEMLRRKPRNTCRNICRRAPTQPTSPDC